MSVAQAAAQQVSRFPPTVDDSPLTYGFALFSLTLVSSLSIAQLLTYWFEGRARKEAEKVAFNLSRIPLPFASAVNVWRWIITGFLFALLFTTGPDVAILLLWGDTAPEHMAIIFLIDRLGDGLSSVPFLFSTALLTWAGQSMPQLLMQHAKAPLRRPTWIMLKDKIRIVVSVLTVAVLMTIAKAIS